MSNIIDKIQLSGVTYDLPSGSGNPTVELTQAQYDALVSGGTVDPDTYYIITDATPQDMSQYWTSAQTNSAITEAVSGKADTSAVTESINAAVSGKQDTLVSGTNIKTINNESILGSGNITIQGGGGGVNVVQTTGTSTTDVMSQDAVTTQLNNKANKSAAVGGYKFGNTNNADYLQYTNVNNDNIANAIYYPKINGKGILTNNSTWAQNNLNFSLVETSAITTNITSSSTDAQVPSAKAVYDALQEGGGGGGGKAIEGGRGISITTGATADTVSFNLPISADSNTCINAGVGNSNTNTALNILIGSGNTAYNGNSGTISGGTAIGFGNEVGYIGREAWGDKSYSFAFGYGNKIQGGHDYVIGEGNNLGRGTNNSKDKSFLIGYYNTCTFNGDSSNNYIFGNYCTVSKGDEFALGKYNASNTGSTDADKTFFSIGNGTADNARHNAFEIRQNGDIYCSDGTNDVKLQDTITATAANTTALGGLSLVKLTQAEYDALATKDNSTLYVIVN